MFVSSRSRSSSLKLDESAQFAQPFCQCWGKNEPIPWQQLNFCSCGEDNEVNEWNWESPDDVVENARSSWVLVSEDQKQVTFHPYYSSGTAAVRGDTPLMLNNHYYWEVKVLTQTYGTDIMVGLGTSKADMQKDRFKFTSLLGQDAESYGLSYRGSIKHDAKVSRESDGFCRGSIVGVRLDMWRGTLQFYVNRKPQGVCFYNMRRHSALYPMLSSTAAQSSMRLIYAASWQASLLVDAAKVLASSVRQCNLPPGLLYTCKSQFWLTLPSEGDAVDDDDDFMDVSMETVPTTSSSQLIETLVAGPYINGFYVDSVDANSRIVIRQ
ncbi:SPRY domain-containing SOCS box protein 3 isoform X2 [Aricia agestis]|uniref:SPRY domain-containing SOCS box protein 3 isoform X2 n=1 Tax=Aricia agestis TaxID=91739 RepID=UPI001C209119|nr:SPRY domain-containing SOCS box protein 3 isoform X2 [Aricia agestis]